MLVRRAVHRDQLSNHDPAAVRRFVDQSAADLQTDYLDLFLMHN